MKFCLLVQLLSSCAKDLYLMAELFRIAWIDSKQKIIPNKSLSGLLSVRVFLLVIECSLYGMENVMEYAAGFFIGGGMFLLCYLVTKGGLGAGDVKLFAVLGLYLGSRRIFTAAFLSVFFAAVYTGIKALLRRTNWKKEIPLGPFVFLGTAAAIILERQG